MAVDTKAELAEIVTAIFESALASSPMYVSDNPGQHADLDQRLAGLHYDGFWLVPKALGLKLTVDVPVSDYCFLYGDDAEAFGLKSDFAIQGGDDVNLVDAIAIVTSTFSGALVKLNDDGIAESARIVVERGGRNKRLPFNAKTLLGLPKLHSLEAFARGLEEAERIYEAELARLAKTSRSLQ